MIFYNRHLEYKPLRSPRDIEEQILEYQISDVGEKASKWSLAINIIVATIATILCWPNFIAIGLCYVATDIVLCIISNVIYNILPYRAAMTTSIPKIEERVAYLEHEYDTSCDLWGRWSTKTQQLKLFLDAEKSYLKTLKEAEEEKVAENTPSSVFDEKINYFKSYKTKLKKYMDKHENAEFLLPVHEAITKLIGVLKNRPIGLDLIPTSTYIYLNELNDIIGKLSKMEAEKFAVYGPSIEKVSKGIENNIEDLIVKINKMDTDDIEVGINVLMQELYKNPESDETTINEEGNTDV